MTLPAVGLNQYVKVPYTSGTVAGVTLSLGRVSSTVNITSATFTALRDYINNERARRKNALVYPPQSDPINRNDYNSLIDALNVPGQGANTFYNDYGGGPNNNVLPTSTYTDGGVGAPTYLPTKVPEGIQTINASHVNDLLYAIEQAALPCLCNCNYCTCNCNYCTCNCNYSCTCNCNYSSDRRLKRNVSFIGYFRGVKVYSFQYLWDDTTYAGVMAQDLVGTKYENALSVDGKGYYVVDYSKLPVKMKEV